MSRPAKTVLACGALIGVVYVVCLSVAPSCLLRAADVDRICRGQGQQLRFPDAAPARVEISGQRLLRSLYTAEPGADPAWDLAVYYDDGGRVRYVGVHWWFEGIAQTAADEATALAGAAPLALAGSGHLREVWALREQQILKAGGNGASAIQRRSALMLQLLRRADGLVVNRYFAQVASPATPTGYFFRDESANWAAINYNPAMPAPDDFGSVYIIVCDRSRVQQAP